MSFSADGTIVVVRELSDWWKSKLQGDLDNYIKSVQDGLNGVAFVDDRQIVGLWGSKS